VASGDEIALQLNLFMLVYELYAWLIRRDTGQLHVLDVEKNAPTLVEACCDTVLDDFMLGIEHDAAPVRQRIEVNTMPCTVKAQFDAVMNGSFTLHAFSEAHFGHEVDRALFEHTGANRRFDFFSAP